MTSHMKNVERKNFLLLVLEKAFEEFKDPSDGLIKLPAFTAEATKAADVFDVATNTTTVYAEAEKCKKAQEKFFKLLTLKRRVEEEGYLGRCDDCDEEIHEDRLTLVPTAEYCVNCLSLRELKKKAKITKTSPV